MKICLFIRMKYNKIHYSKLTRLSVILFFFFFFDIVYILFLILRIFVIIITGTFQQMHIINIANFLIFTKLNLFLYI